MDFEVRRVCEAGRVVQPHLRDAGRTRGTVSIKQEQDRQRRRSVLVAHLLPKQGFRAIPALHDVQLISSNGETWVLAGVERIETGPMREECSVGQTWLLTLAVVDDLLIAETRWGLASAEAAELRCQLDALRADPAQKNRRE